MKAELAVVVVLALTSLAASAEPLQRLSLDDAASVTPRVAVDNDVKVEGKGALRITTRWPTTVSLAEVVGPDIEDAKLVYSARVKTELAGTAFLELWAEVGGRQYFSRGMNDAIAQTTDWKILRTPFVFQSGQRPEKLTLNIVINGAGTVWVDDIVLSREPLDETAAH
jgi:hypothetical protein